MSPIAKRRKLDHNIGESKDASSSPSGSMRNGGAQSRNSGKDNDLHADKDGGLGDRSKTNGRSVHDAKNAKSNKYTERRLVTKSSSAQLTMSASTGGHSALLKLQIDELLTQVRPVQDERSVEALAALNVIKTCFESLASQDPTALAVAERVLIKSGIAIPFPDPRPSQNVQYKLSFEAPSNINVIGSYACDLGLDLGRPLSIDMMVEMPESLFQDKDYSDHRYFYRRAHYLACLGAGLRNGHASDYDLQFDCFNGNPLHTYLRITSKKDPSWQINILPSISRQVFADNRLALDKNLVRESSDTLSSFYNSSIQHDRQMSAYLKLLHTVSKSCGDYSDACLLLRVWLRQRGLSSTIEHGGFGNFESSALLAALLNSGDLSSRYNAYQLFKATLQYIAIKDCINSSVIIGKSSEKLPIDQNIPILWDADRSHNLLYKMTTASYRGLRGEARTTIDMLSEKADRFDETFVLNLDSLQIKYDQVYTCPIDQFAKSSRTDCQLISELNKLSLILSRAFGDRITLINIQISPTQSWDLGTARPSWKSKSKILLALRFDASNAPRNLDQGPSAEEIDEAEDFRKFWGEKAELRRFKDGGILECLFWESTSGAERIMDDILRYILSRHYGKNAAIELQRIASESSSLVTKFQAYTDFTPVMDALKQVESDLRALEGLPLTVRQIMATDSQACYSSIDVPGSAFSTSPISIMIQFESSSRWPDDLKAVQRTKAAFLLHIASLLQTSNSDLSCRVGIENIDRPTLNQVFLDITYPQPPRSTFRLRINHDRELSQIQTMLKNKSLTPPDRDATVLALSYFKRDFVASPLHTANIQKLCTRFAALSPTIRLVKSWFSAHNLLSHVPQPIIEQFCSYTFLQPFPWTIPSSAKTGLLQTLSWLSHWNWKEQPLVIHHPDSPLSDLISTAQTRFEAWRKIDPAMNRVCLFVATNADPEGTVWTDIAAGGPRKVVCGRMTQLVRAAMEYVTNNERDMNWKTLFESRSHDYDFVIYLSDEVVGNTKDLKKKKRNSNGFKNLQLVSNDTTSDETIGFDAVKMFLDELEGVYDQTAVFFYGGNNQNIIGGLWNPSTFSRGWKVNLGYSTIVQEDKQGDIQAVINKNGILAEIARLGGSMITRIDSH